MGPQEAGPQGLAFLFLGVGGIALLGLALCAQVKTTQRYSHLAPQTLLDTSTVATLAVGSVMGVLPNRVVDVPMLVVGS